MAERVGLRPVRKPRSVRRLGPVDVAPLRALVARLSDKAWNRENAAKENDFSCFTHTRHIIFRFVPRDSTRPCFYSMPLWNLWQRWLLPVMTRAAAPYGFAAPVYPKAMLARLAAGRGIDPHIDHGGMNPLVHKIHVPLETGPRATLTVRGVPFHLRAGHAWEVNNLAPHGAFNGEDHDRIHFIFEVFEGAGVGMEPQTFHPRTRGCRGRGTPATVRQNPPGTTVVNSSQRTLRCAGVP